jgi:ribosomal protein S18 acetylase RimI-like enzyme
MVPFLRSDLKIRRAVEDDADALASIHVTSWRAAYRDIVPDSVLSGMNETQRAIQFREAIAANREETHILESAVEALGFLTLGPARDNDLDPRSDGEIWGIYVSPAYWRNGLGAILLEEAQRMLRDRQFRTVYLWVFCENEAARSFYFNAGFEPDGHKKEIPWERPASAMRLAKPLL